MTARKQSTSRNKKPASRTTHLLQEVTKFAKSEAGRDPGRFLEVLRSSFSGYTIDLFDIKGRRVKAIGSTAQLDKLASQEDVNACLASQTAVQIKSGRKTSVLVPIVVNGAVSMLIVAAPGPRSRANTKELVTLIGVYGDILSLFQVSERDALTGLYNRRTLDRNLPELIHGLRSPRRRTSDPATAHLALLDLDHFKKVNDTFGHLQGDEVLLLFSGLMKQSFRSSDLLVRYGGEEFIVVLGDVTMANCEMVLERFRKKIAEHVFPDVGHITVSTGAARIEAQRTAAEILGQADQALYHAKKTGRDRVCMYEKLVNEGLIKVKASATRKKNSYTEKRKLPTRRKASR